MSASCRSRLSHLSPYLVRAGGGSLAEFYEMAFIVDGEGVHLFNGVTYPLTRGALFLLTPTDIHALWPNPGSTLELFNVIFSDTMLDEEVEPLLFRELADHHIQFPELVRAQVGSNSAVCGRNRNRQRAGRTRDTHAAAAFADRRGSETPCPQMLQKQIPWRGNKNCTRR